MSWKSAEARREQKDSERAHSLNMRRRKRKAKRNNRKSGLRRFVFGTPERATECVEFPAMAEHSRTYLKGRKRFDMLRALFGGRR